MKVTTFRLVSILLFSGALLAEDSRTFQENSLEISIVKGDSFAPFKKGKGFWTYKVTVVNTNKEEARTLNGKLILKSGGKDISDCTVFVPVDAGATENKDVNCKYSAEPIEDFDLKIIKVYNKKM